MLTDDESINCQGRAGLEYEERIWIQLAKHWNITWHCMSIFFNVGLKQGRYLDISVFCFVCPNSVSANHYILTVLSSVGVFCPVAFPHRHHSETSAWEPELYLPLQSSFYSDFVSVLNSYLFSLRGGYSTSSSSKLRKTLQWRFIITFKKFDHWSWHNCISVYKKNWSTVLLLKRLTYTEIGKGIRCTGFLI